MKWTLALLTLASCASLPPTTWVAEESKAEALRREGPLDLDELITVALERQPDLRAASERIAQAQARVDEATSAFYPRILARLSYARTDHPSQAFAMIVARRDFSPTLDINDPGATDHLRPELVATFPLFRGGADAARREAALLGVDAAELERSAIRNALVAAVTDAYYAWLSVLEQVGVANASVTAVGTELEEARKRHEAGAALKSDVLSLEVRLAAALEQQLVARLGVDHAVAALRLLLALRPGEPLEIDPAPPPSRAGRGGRRPEIDAARTIVAMREREVAAEWAAHLPRVDAFGSYGWDSGEENWAFGIAIDLDLFTGFATSARVTAARARLAEARALEERVERAVEHEIRSAELDLRAAGERVRVNETALRAAEEAFRMVREQYAAGTVTVTRYLEAEAARTDVRSRVIAARYDVRRAEARLLRAKGEWR